MANTLNALGLSLIGLGLPSFDAAYWIGLLVHGPGVNNTSAAALKAITTDHAVANGILRGAYGGMYSSLRTLSMVLAPPCFGWAYKNVVDDSKKFPSFLPWVMVAFAGAVLPEVLHRSLTDDDMKLPEPQAQKSQS